MGKLVSKSKTPVRDKFLPYGHQWIHDEDIDAVVKALRNDWVSQDSKVNNEKH